MTDDHLSDHEWRMKMAHEGRASYIPGKTFDEVKVERMARDRAAVDAVAYSVELPAGLWADLPDAISELVYVLHHAADGFDHFQENLSNAGGDPGLIGLAELSARGLRAILDKEGLAVERLGTAVRQINSKAVEDRITKEAMEETS